MIKTLCHFSEVPTLETDRLILKPLNRYFLSKDYVNWLNDEEVNRYLESGGDYTLEKLDDYLEEVERNPKYFWAIILKETNKHIGNIKIDPIDLNHLFGEYGIMIGDRTVWGKGIGFEATSSVIDFCFNILCLEKINLGLHRSNIKALRLYKKLGFKNSLNNKLEEKSKKYFQDSFRMTILNKQMIK